MSEWLQSPFPFLRHISLEDSSDTFVNVIIVELNRRNLVGIERTTHVTKLVRAKLKRADSAADECGHQILTTEPGADQLLESNLKCLGQSMALPRVVVPILLRRGADRKSGDTNLIFFPVFLT